MREKADLYDSSYANYDLDVYRKVRIATYGEDFGQTSWVNTAESNEIPHLLHLTPGCFVVEIGCGSGAYALHLAEKTGCRLVGFDINQQGVWKANELAFSRNLSARVRFDSATLRSPCSWKAQPVTLCFRTTRFATSQTGLVCSRRFLAYSGRAEGCSSATPWSSAE